MTAKKRPKRFGVFGQKRRHTDTNGDQWRLTLRFTLDELGMRCTGLEINPADESVGPTITTTVLRELPLREWAAEEAADLLKRAPAKWIPPEAGRALKVEAARGPRASSLAHYRQVVEVYRAAALKGQHATKAVAEHFGVSRNLAATWVHRAKHTFRDEFSPTRQGRQSI